MLVMFQRPHSYIPLSWYEQENVPTWNYQAVHIYGSACFLSEDELKPDLTKLLEKYEEHRENPVLWSKLSPDLLEKELKGIVGFNFQVQEIQAAYKMSQNRNEKDYRAIRNGKKSIFKTNGRKNERKIIKLLVYLSPENRITAKVKRRVLNNGAFPIRLIADNSRCKVMTSEIIFPLLFSIRLIPFGPFAEQ